MGYRSPKQITMANMDEVRAHEPDRPLPTYLRLRPPGKTWPPWAPHPLAIRIMLDASGLSPTDFAAKMNVGLRDIGEWQTGFKAPSALSCEKMREAFPDLYFRAMQCAERFEYEKISSPKRQTAMSKKTLMRNQAPHMPPSIQVAAAKHMLDRNLGLPVAPSVVVNTTVTEFEALKKKLGARVLPAEYVEQMKKAGYYKDAEPDRKPHDVPAAPEANGVAPSSTADQTRADREPSG